MNDEIIVIQSDTPLDSCAPTSTNSEVLLGIYAEICKSYHAVDDFRMKLLSLLPLASLIGIFGLGRESLFGQAATSEVFRHLIAFIGVFGALFTLALLTYEIRGIHRCDLLVSRGRDIETLLGTTGQFCVCVQQHESKKSKHLAERITAFVDAKLSACLIYSIVSAAWLFTALRFGFDVEVRHCILWTLFTGTVLGLCAYSLVKQRVPA